MLQCISLQVPSEWLHRNFGKTCLCIVAYHCYPSSPTTEKMRPNSRVLLNLLPKYCANVKNPALCFLALGKIKQLLINLHLSACGIKMSFQGKDQSVLQAAQSFRAVGGQQGGHDHPRALLVMQDLKRPKDKISLIA